MKTTFIWSRRLLIALMLFLSAAWFFAEASQWILRWEAERLLVDLRSFDLSRGTSAEAEAFLRRWGRRGDIVSSCHGDKCYSRVYINHMLPAIFRGDSEDQSKNLLPRAMDLVGLRSARVGAGFNLEHGVVTQKWFLEDVQLPMKEEWSLPGLWYYPEIDVSSIEVAEFGEFDRRNFRTSHPFRMASDIKSGFGLMVWFKPDESASEQAALMDFQFSCITRFFPCQSEREILPEGWQMLQEHQ